MPLSRRSSLDWATVLRDRRHTRTGPAGLMAPGFAFADTWPEGDSAARPSRGPEMQPVADSTAQPLIDSTTPPVPGPVTQPVPGPVAQSVSGPVVQPVSGSGKPSGPDFDAQSAPGSELQPAFSPGPGFGQDSSSSPGASSDVHGAVDSDHTLASLESGIAAYRALLLRWGRVHNLVGSLDPVAVDAQMLECLDASLGILHLLGIGPAGAAGADVPTLIDVGTGAGLPGLLLALLARSAPVVLLDPNPKKAAFLTTAVAELGLRHCDVAAVRIEQWQRPVRVLGSAESRVLGSPESRVAGPPEPHVVDSPESRTEGSPQTPGQVVYVSRAFAALDRLAASCAVSALQGDRLIALKSTGIDQEIDAFRASPAGWHLDGLRHYDVPELGLSRQLVLCTFNPR